MVLRGIRRFYRGDEAEDVLQEVFMRVLDKLDSFRGDSSPVTWLYQLTTRYGLNRLRNEGRRRELLDDTLSSTPGAIAFPILYIDADASGSWNQEWILGSSNDAFVLYFDESPALPDADTLGSEFAPVLGYSVVAPPDCQASTPPVPLLTNPSQVHLEIGDAFFTHQPDLNSDGSQPEWAAPCACGCGDPS